MHYDLWLEAGGVLKSWVLRKLPPNEMGIRRLEIPDADHSLKYGTFEGPISQGYGAGTVKI